MHVIQCMIGGGIGQHSAQFPMWNLILPNEVMPNVFFFLFFWKDVLMGVTVLSCVNNMFSEVFSDVDEIYGSNWKITI